MKPKETIVLIDGNNTCFRVGWANKHLTNHGEPTGVIYGFMRDIVGVWERWKHAKIIVIWDGGTDFRLNLSKEGITNGVITEKYGYYKQNRERQREKEEAEGKINELFESVGIQKPTLFKLLKLMELRPMILLELWLIFMVKVVILLKLYLPTRICISSYRSMLAFSTWVEKIQYHVKHSKVSMAYLPNSGLI